MESQEENPDYREHVDSMLIRNAGGELRIDTASHHRRI
jgi:hypothetical protein